VTYFRLSADQGCDIGQVGYRFALELGIRTEENVEEAVKHLRLAAHQGSDASRFECPFCLTAGTGIEQNVEGALKIKKLAAEQRTNERDGYIAAISNRPRQYQVSMDRLHAMESMASGQPPHTTKPSILSLTCDLILF
jgi:hypothetical protein